MCNNYKTECNPLKFLFFQKSLKEAVFVEEDMNEMPEEYSIQSFVDYLNITKIGVSHCNDDNILSGLNNIIHFCETFSDLMDNDNIIIPFINSIEENNFLFTLSEIIFNSGNDVIVEHSLEILSFIYSFGIEHNYLINFINYDLIDKLINLVIAPDIILKEKKLPQLSLFGLFGTINSMQCDIYNGIIVNSLISLINICLISDSVCKYILNNNYHTKLANDIFKNKLNEENVPYLFIRLILSLIRNNGSNYNFAEFCNIFLTYLQNNEQVNFALDGIMILIQANPNAIKYLLELNLDEKLNRLSYNQNLTKKLMILTTLIVKQSPNEIKQELYNKLKLNFWSNFEKSRDQDMLLIFCKCTRKLVKYSVDMRKILNKKIIIYLINIMKDDNNFEIKKESIKTITYVIKYLPQNLIKYCIDEQILDYVSDFILEVDDKFLIILLDFLLFLTTIHDKELHQIILTEFIKLNLMESILSISDSDNDIIVNKAILLDEIIESMFNEKN